MEMNNNIKTQERNRADVKAALNVLQKLNKIKSEIKTEEKGNPPEATEFMRDEVISCEVDLVKNNPSIPITPPTCAGTSYQCRVEGSGNTKTKTINTMPCSYDMIGTQIKDGNYFRFENDILHNWNNSSNETQYTKDSLRNTYGFENFQ